MTWPLMKIFFFFLVPIFSFFFLFLLFSIDEDVKNLAVTNNPRYSDYESDDESDYGSSNSEVYIEDFPIILHLFFSTSDGIL